MDRPAKCRWTQDSHKASIYEKWNLNLLNEAILKELTCKCWKKFTIFQTLGMNSIPTNTSSQEAIINWEYYRLSEKYYCSDTCRNLALYWQSIFPYEKQQNITWLEYWVPVIYKITNKINWKSYIWKTHQSFTLRWWQHLKENNTEKFWKAISEWKIEDWSFEVVKVLTKEEVPEVLKIEDEYIKKYDTVENWYNTRYNLSQK